MILRSNRNEEVGKEVGALVVGTLVGFIKLVGGPKLGFTVGFIVGLVVVGFLAGFLVGFVVGLRLGFPVGKIDNISSVL